MNNGDLRDVTNHLYFPHQQEAILLKNRESISAKWILSILRRIFYTCGEYRKSLLLPKMYRIYRISPIRHMGRHCKQKRENIAHSVVQQSQKHFSKEQQQTGMQTSKTTNPRHTPRVILLRERKNGRETREKINQS